MTSTKKAASKHVITDKEELALISADLYMSYVGSRHVVFKYMAHEIQTFQQVEFKTSSLYTFLYDIKYKLLQRQEKDKRSSQMSFNKTTNPSFVVSHLSSSRVKLFKTLISNVLAAL